MENETQSQEAVLEKQYFYITKGNNHSARLSIDEVDILTNADGEMDCPIETVLRKNGRSIYDLLSWETKEIQFVLVEDGVEQILRSIPVDLSLE